MKREELRPYLRRLAWVFVISLIGSFVASEAAFRLQPNNIDRAPQVVEIIIPEGTAERVAAGEDVPSIPSEMVFVVGDVLLVRNEDSVSHELGPLLVPAGSSASLPMEQAENFAMNCSFQSSSYLGVDVKEPTTIQTRLTGLSFSVPPTTLMLFLYSLVAKPVVGAAAAAPRKTNE